MLDVTSSTDELRFVSTADVNAEALAKDFADDDAETSIAEATSIKTTGFRRRTRVLLSHFDLDNLETKEGKLLKMETTSQS